jgi:7,8-dihydro-6-hydroxymethylpterin-pyrophosphokinase
MHERRFVIEPMNDLAPDFVHPTLKKSMKQLLDEINAN